MHRPRPIPIMLTYTVKSQQHAQLIKLLRLRQSLQLLDKPRQPMHIYILTRFDLLQKVLTLQAEHSATKSEIWTVSQRVQKFDCII
jgi:hypothetical protein